MFLHFCHQGFLWNGFVIVYRTEVTRNAVFDPNVLIRSNRIMLSAQHCQFELMFRETQIRTSVNLFSQIMAKNEFDTCQIEFIL